MYRVLRLLDLISVLWWSSHYRLIFLSTNHPAPWLTMSIDHLCLVQLIDAVILSLLDLDLIYWCCYCLLWELRSHLYLLMWIRLIQLVTLLYHLDVIIDLNIEAIKFYSFNKALSSNRERGRICCQFIAFVTPDQHICDSIHHIPLALHSSFCCLLILHNNSCG